MRKLSLVVVALAVVSVAVVYGGDGDDFGCALGMADGP